MNAVSHIFASVLAGLLLTTLMTGSSKKDFVVSGPTVIAFFPPVTSTELNDDPDTNEALADFQLYAKNVREPFHRADVDFREVYAVSFRLRSGSVITNFRPGKMGVGYYLVAPGKKPRIEYGVLTDADLRKIASEYFGLSVK